MTNPLESHLEAEFSLERDPGAPIESPPFHLLVLSDLSAEGENPALDARKPIEIDRDNFDDVMRRIAPRLHIELDQHQSITLSFSELDDFHPDRLFENLPLFSQLRDLRKRLNSETSFFAAAREVRESISGAEPVASSEYERDETDVRPTGTTAGGILDSIIDSSEGGGVRPRRSDDDLSNFVAELVRPHLVSVDENERSGYLDAIDNATSASMRAILHDHAFQKLEATWRGLYLLVRRVETSPDLKIFVIDISAEELSDNLKTANSLADSVFYRHVIRDTIEAPGGTPWAAIVANYDLEPTVDDIALLMRVSKIVAVANSPFITHIRPDLLGVRSLAENPDASKWDLSENSEAGRLWTALRRQSESQFLGVVMPRVLGREPYGSATDPVESFAFEEFEGAPGHEDYLWSNPCFVTAALLGMSFSEAEWSMGKRMAQDIDGLPSHIYQNGSEKDFRPCTEALLSESAIDKMIEYGLMPIAGYKGTDKCRLTMIQSIAGTALKSMWS